MFNDKDKNLVIERFAKGQEDELIRKYIILGPSKMKEEVFLTDEEFEVVFDYLVFENNLLYKCVVANVDFFLDQYVRHGMAHLRDMLGVLNEKYDAICEVIFDFLVISHDGLLLHVIEHRGKYLDSLNEYGSEFVRKVLGVSGAKYSENWEKVLDFLLKSVVKNIVSEKTFEQGIDAFTMIYNGSREQRQITKEGIL
ncbi:hypothetical protein COY05_04820 [Candidatus Peregrinibacteria bacterium CG_4_10_14_0_2_um_filter_38_24]|nr:MAG: hypothetical protein COY05_04820 [Candidatus Peregrinibacteria bacterium CG_4_10_14_0_2_um_filter_38_24]